MSKDMKIILKYFMESCNRKLLSNVLKAQLCTFKIICVTWFVLHSGTLGGLFSQILQGEDIVRERAIKFLSTKLKTLPEEVLTKEVEEFILTESKKVSVFNFVLSTTLLW